MNYINPEDQKIKNALNKHKEELVKELEIRRDKNCNLPQLSNYLTKKIIIDIITKKPDRLVKLSNDLYKDLVDIDSNLLTEEIKKIFKYEKWFDVKKKTKYEAYDLAKNIDINTCTYCNRIYTKTVISKVDKKKTKKITRPEFDHWFPKSKYPLLALSFYNLIPSCHVCNSSVKGVVEFKLSTHIHPYIDENINLQYSYEFNGDLNNHKFKIKYRGDKGKTKNTAEAFELKEIYETHEDEIKDLLRIKSIYSDTYLKKLNNLLGVSVSYKEIYRLAFGTYIEESKFEKRPLSRMKRDILKELGIANEEDYE